jgi:hypothetical protein
MTSPLPLEGVKGSVRSIAFQNYGLYEQRIRPASHGDGGVMVTYQLAQIPLKSPSTALPLLRQ